jgi:hypothetical protein
MENKVKALNIRLRYLRFNNGGEYTFKEFGRYCKEKGILSHLTIVYTPQQNVIAQWLNQTTNKGKSLIHDVVEGVSNSSRTLEASEAPCQIKVGKALRRVASLVKREIGYYSFGDMPQKEDPIELEELLKQPEVEDQAITGVPLTKAPDHKDQPKSSRRLSGCSSNALERYGPWENFSLLKEQDIVLDEDDSSALILEEGEPFSYNEAQTCESKFK